MKKSLIASLAALALSAPVVAKIQPNPKNPSDGLTIAKFNEVWQGYVGEAADKKITHSMFVFQTIVDILKLGPTKRNRSCSSAARSRTLLLHRLLVPAFRLFVCKSRLLWPCAYASVASAMSGPKVGTAQHGSQSRPSSLTSLAE